MELNEVASIRRSVRKYKETSLKDDEIQSKIKDALQFVIDNSPSWKNSQTHRYYVATSKESMEKVASCLPERNRVKCDNAVAIIVSTFVKGISGFNGDVPENELGNEWGSYDLGLSDSLLLLKLREEGLDSLIMGIRDGEAIRKELKVPQEEEVVSVISVGERMEEAKMPPRKSYDEIVKSL